MRAALRRAGLRTAGVVVVAAGVVGLPQAAHAGTNDWITVGYQARSCVHYSFGDICQGPYKTQRRDIAYCARPPLPGGVQEWYGYCYRRVNA